MPALSCCGILCFKELAPGCNVFSFTAFRLPEPLSLEENLYPLRFCKGASARVIPLRDHAFLEPSRPVSHVLSLLLGRGARKRERKITLESVSQRKREGKKKTTLERKRHSTTWNWMTAGAIALSSLVSWRRSKGKEGKNFYAKPRMKRENKDR